MNRQINYKTMRIMVGVLAIILAPLVCALANSEHPLTSISISYWTNSHDIFVGSLIAVGFFLLAYNGAGEKRDLEFYLSKAACIFSTCVALFPTSGFSDQDVPPAWTSKMTEAVGLEPSHIHYGAAVLLFACLIAIMWIFSKRAKSKGKYNRSIFYRATSILMASGILAIFSIGKITNYSKTVLIVEIWGLTLFGLGWLVAGSYKTEPSQG